MRGCLFHYSACCRIADEYQYMSIRALTVPPNTSELIQLTAFVEKAETEMSMDLENRLREVLKYIFLVSNYIPMTSIEIKTTNSAFQW
jgi:hypothetical protein